jgi:lysophospholipase L1-like esterase
MAVKSGYGPGFCALLTEGVTCLDMAKGGRSSGSYRAEGSWTQVMDQLKTNSTFKDTYVLIQFGHNDQPGKPGRSTDLATEFPVNLAHYVEDVKSTGARPILVTALTRRSFQDGKLTNNLEPWAAATRKVAAEENVPVLDLNAESFAAVQKMGPTEANTLAMGPLPPVAVESAALGNAAPVPKANGAEFDYTHLGDKGAAYFGRMVADELMHAIPALKPCFKPS